jgi:hypothetical protein
MLLPLLATAAVLLPGEVVIVSVDPPAVVARVPIAEAPATLFAAPDGRFVAPLSGRDATHVVSRSGATHEWPGRTFPLFFDEGDRLYAVISGAVTLLSYPERLLLQRVAVPGLAGAWRAACSRDGGLVVVAGAPLEEQTLHLVAMRGVPGSRRISLAIVPRELAIDPGGRWVLAGGDGAVQLVTQEGGAGPLLAFAGVAIAFAAGSDGKDAVAVVVEGEKGVVIGLRLSPGRRVPLAERFRTPLPGRPVAAAMAGEVLVVALPDRLLLLPRAGRGAAVELEVPAGSAVVALPENPRSLLPGWSGERGREATGGGAVALSGRHLPCVRSTRSGAVP